MKKTLFNILKFGVLVIGCILLGFSVYNCSASKASGDKLPMPFGFGFAVVVSGSMEPTISINDMIIVKKADEYVQDDFVVFHQNGLLVVHRLIGFNDDTGEVITKGDANNSADTPIKYDSIKGKVVGHIRGVGPIINFFKSPIVVVLILGCAFFLMEYSFKKEKDEKKEQIEKIKEEIRELQKKE